MWMRSPAGSGPICSCTRYPGRTVRAGTEYKLASNATGQSLPTRRKCFSAAT